MRTPLSALVMLLALTAAASGIAGAADAAAVTKPSAARAAAPKHSAAKQVLPWIEDDWPRAVALAKQRKVPIFVESWAPW